ncbi:MAG: hypothetical protein P8J02_05810 [Yoonia sp.]|nr:hypothetical protein [Yoonia sp.]
MANKWKIPYLPEELATYKGFIANRPMMLDYLSKFDDGLPTSDGIWPEFESEPPLKPSADS